MSVIPQTVEFDHKVTWTIKHFGFRPKYHERLPITSPEFVVRCLDVTTWSFDLHPNGLTQYHNMQFAVRLHYSSSRDVAELHIIFVKYVIYLIDGSGLKCFKKEGSFTPSFAEPTSSAINFVPLAYFEDEKHLRNGALVVVCELTTKVNQVEFLSSVYNDQMISLSNRLTEMIESPTHSDMIAYSKEKVPFDVHVCILKARCPILFSDPLDPVDYTPRGPAWLSSISTHALKALIFYIYGRMTIEVQDFLKAELMSVAIRYGLLDLERKLREYPIDLSIASDIVVENIIFKYPLHDLNWEYDNETLPQLHFLPTRNLGVSDLVVSSEVTRIAYREEDYLKIGFQFSDFEMGMPILLKCTLCLLDDGGRVLDRREHWHTFSSDDEWTPPPFLTRNGHQLHRPHTLRCNVLLTETSLEGQVSSNVCRVEPGRCVLFNNLLLVGDELLKLYLNQLNCDLRMKVQQLEFLGHKSFLVKRSPKIGRKVENAEKAMAEERSDMVGLGDMVVIRLNNITPHVCNMVLLYMYSGRIDIADSETAKMLGKAASYFHLPRLLEKSFFFRIEKGNGNCCESRRKLKASRLQIGNRLRTSHMSDGVNPYVLRKNAVDSEIAKKLGIAPNYLHLAL